MKYINFNIDNKYVMPEIIDLFHNFPRLNSVYSAVSYFLNILSNFPNLEFSSYFTLNLKSFEFEHFDSHPSESKELSKEVFEYLTTAGFIGDSVQQRTITIDSENQFQKIFIVAPLISFNNITGIIILSIKDGLIDNYNNNTFILNLICSQFANKIESLILMENISNFEKVMEQNISERTMNLLKSNAEMHEKFANLRNNLTLSLPHEIRTPIGMITGNTDILVNYVSDLSKSDIVDIARDIQISSLRIKHLLENYLTFANLEILAIDPVALEKLRTDTLHSSNYIIEDIVYSLSSKYDREGDIKSNLIEANINISEENFIKMLSEVVDNALKYSTKGTIVNVESYLFDDNIVISVTDHGRGLTQEQIEKIDAYMQFERKEYEQQGLGLGLAIARRIIELYDGTFKLESTYGEYLTVHIILHLVDNKPVTFASKKIEVKI